MKQLLLFSMFCFSLLSVGQNIELSINDIAEAEAKASRNLVNFRTNPNTGNYDVVYHRLELEVDPSQWFISGDVTSKIVKIAL